MVAEKKTWTKRGEELGGERSVDLQKGGVGIEANQG